MAYEDYIKENAERYGVPIIRENSHKKLENIVRNLKPKQILEIGTAVAYSAITMLKAAENSFVYTIEHDHDKVLQARENLKIENLQDRCQVAEDDCLAHLATMLASDKWLNHFDFCFLDGPKAQYRRTYELVLPLMKTGGVIVADNVLFRGYVINKQGMPRRFKTIVKRLKEFLDFIPNDERVQNYEIDNEDDGLLIIKLK